MPSITSSFLTKFANEYPAIVAAVALMSDDEAATLVATAYVAAFRSHEAPAPTIEASAEQLALFAAWLAESAGLDEVDARAASTLTQSEAARWEIISHAAVSTAAA